MKEARKPLMTLRMTCPLEGRPGSMHVSADGSKLFILDEVRPLLSVVGVAGWQLLERVDVGARLPHRPVLLAGFEDSIFLGGLPGTVRIFSAASHRVHGSIPCAGDACDLEMLPELRQSVLATASGNAGWIEFVGLWPVQSLGRLELPLPPRRHSLTLLRGHGLGAVVYGGPESREEGIALFECRSSAEPAYLRMSGGVRSLAFEPEGRWLYAACHDDSMVAVIDVREKRVVERVLMAGEPFRLACDPVGRRVWALCEKLGHVAVIDPMDHSVERRTPLGGLAGGTERITFSPEGRLAVVPESESGCLSLLESGSLGADYGALDDGLELGREIGRAVWSPLGEDVYLAAPSPGAVLRIAVDRGDQEIKDTDLYLMDQLLRQEDPVRLKNPLFPP